MLSFLVIIIETAPIVKAPTTWYVDDVAGVGPGNPPEDFTLIQDAINASSDGDTVFVYNGTYYDKLVVNRSINLTGENKNSTIIDGDGLFTSIIWIEANHTIVSGFTIRNGGLGAWNLNNNNNITISGNFFTNTGTALVFTEDSHTIIDNHFQYNGGVIRLTGSSNNIIDNFLLNNYGVGIYLNGGWFNNVFNNTLSSSSGIDVRAGDSNKVIGNKISNDNYGIAMYHGADGNYIINNTIMNTTEAISTFDSSYGNSFIGNNISESDYGIESSYLVGDNKIEDNIMLSNIYGIYLDNTYDVINITNNRLINNEYGIYFINSGRNNITGNTFFENTYGIYFNQSNKSQIKYNIITSNNESGVCIINSDNNIIRNNTISCNGYGLNLLNSSDNIFHHNNIIKNVNQACLTNSLNNIWDDGMGEGNYWSDYNGVDDGSNGRVAGDGVGDTEIPHPFIDQGNGYYMLDNYPLVNPLGNYIFLYEGWNLISIPFIQLNNNLGTVLSSITGSFSAVQRYNSTDLNDQWKHNSIKKPYYLNDLHNIDHKMGFWVYITKPGGVLFEYLGMEPISNQSITLNPGWNLVGYPSLTNHNRTDGLNNLTLDTHVDAIWTYNAATQKWKEITESDYFELGRGYWIHAKTTCEWEVPL